MYWLYFIEAGLFQIFAGMVAHRVLKIEGRIGFIAAIIFSGPLTYFSYILDEEYFLNYRLLGVLGILIGLTISILLAKKLNN